MKTVDKNQTLAYTRLNETGNQTKNLNSKENTMYTATAITGGHYPQTITFATLEAAASWLIDHNTVQRPWSYQFMKFRELLSGYGGIPGLSHESQIPDFLADEDEPDEDKQAVRDLMDWQLQDVAHGDWGAEILYIGADDMEICRPEDFEFKLEEEFKERGYRFRELTQEEEAVLGTISVDGMETIPRLREGVRVIEEEGCGNSASWGFVHLKNGVMLQENGDGTAHDEKGEQYVHVSRGVGEPEEGEYYEYEYIGWVKASYCEVCHVHDA